MIAQSTWCGVLLSVLLASSLPALEAAQCLPDETNPCIARCNGTTFDISNLFDYPYDIGGFKWNPCEGLKCSGQEPEADCAVCQHADQYYNCGRHKQPIWIWYIPYYSKMNSSDTLFISFPDWRIEYPGGTQWRISLFTFVIDEKQEEPTVVFTGESPSLQYNFEVRGKCIGQVTEECKQKYNQK